MLKLHVCLLWTRHVLAIMGQNSYSQGTCTVVYEVNNCLRENHLLYFNVYVYVPTSVGQAGGYGGHACWELGGAWSFQQLDGETQPARKVKKEKKRMGKV